MNKYEKALRKIIGYTYSWDDFTSQIDEISINYNMPKSQVLKDLDRILQSDDEK